MSLLTRRIEELLRHNATNERVRRCLDAIRGEASSLQSTSPLPIQHARRIYSIRAEANAGRPDLVEGYDDLLKALSSETDDSVQVHLLEGDKEVFSIFTSPDTTRLYGLLISKQSSLKTSQTVESED